jgi:membrane associated rhomboid family serine protease
MTVLITVLTALISWQGFSRPALVERFLFDRERIVHQREWYRTITSAFFHADWGHLLFNLISFYSFATGIERLYGGAILFVIYFASILGGSALSFWLHHGESYRALGASGGVCGVIYASIFLLPGSSIYIFFIPYPIPASVYAVLFLVISIWGIKSRMGNIGHDAHLGGALVGLLVTSLLYPRIIQAQPILYATILIISIALMIWLLKYRRTRRF